MVSEHQIRLYGSANLREWKVLSDFGPAGYTGSGWECPSLMELPVEGSPGVTKWVMMNSVGGGKRGVFMQYWVGDFDGKTFHNDNPADMVLPVDYGDCFYAAIPFNDAPGDAKILVGWMIPGEQATFPWTGQFSIPRDLSLRRVDSGYRLVQEPSAVVMGAFSKLPAASRRDVASLEVSGRDVALHGLGGNTWMLDALLSVSPGAVAGFKVGVGSDGTGTVIGYDAEHGQVYVDRSKSGAAKIRPGGERQTFSVGGNGSVRLQILVDKGSLEVFVNGGEQVLTTYIYPEEGATGCSAFSSGGKAVIKDLKTWDLSKL
jgi:levanase/fructan beta-fructosidase